MFAGDYHHFEQNENCTEVTTAIQISQASGTTYWRKLFEMQNSTIKAILTAPHKISTQYAGLPVFDPDTIDADARIWCAAAERCFAIKTMAGDQLIDNLNMALKGPALPWLYSISYAGMTWSEFKCLFLARFMSMETEARFLTKLITSKPSEGEALDTYGKRIFSAVYYSSGSPTERFSVAITIAHLSQFHERLKRLALTSDINDYEQLEKELEASINLKRKTNPESTTSSSSTSSVRCFQCHQVGHKQADCLYRQGAKGKRIKTHHLQASRPHLQQQGGTYRFIICYKCGRHGHISPWCTSTPRT